MIRQFFRACVAQRLPALACIGPADPAARGSQLGFRHAQAYPICRALIARGVIGDFRDPDILRFGFAPLYVAYEDVFLAATALAEVIESDAWDCEAFRKRAAVT